ncbi:MAG: carboxypeptidase regulatory-like domain-containing protein [Gemmatimonadaceae bacterium]
MRGASPPAVLRFIGAIAVIAAVPAASLGQTIRGTVVDRGNAPVPGVVVVLVDAHGSVASRALTNAGGEFRVSATAAGAYRLRTMRIGFRPTMSAALALGVGQEVSRQIVLAGVPFLLDTVRVAGRSSCRLNSDSAAATFAIWEQVRTALTATQLTQGTRALGARFVHYRRSLDPDRERVLSQSSTISAGFTTRIWVSPSADSLRRAGYVVSNVDGTTTYFAPDLTVLLSDAFIEDHCFRLAAEKDGSRIGIAFEPTRERRRVAGIRGTVWLDRKSSELRSMDFRYTNATREQEYGDAGGHMAFAPARNGAWVISGWSIRMPVLEQRQVSSRGFGSGVTRLEFLVKELRVEGGELALLTRNRDTLWARPSLPLAGTVLDSVTGTREAGARVAVRGTALVATTDSAGRFRIPDILPGQYTLDIRSRSLASLGAAHSIPLTLTDSTTALTIRVPTATQVAALLCSTLGGIVAGSVRMRGDSVPPRNVTIAARWNETTATVKRWGGLEARSDARGAFRICNVPINTVVTLIAQTDSASAAPVEVRIPATQRYTAVELLLDHDLPRGAVLSGFVLSDVNGQPIADVEVAIPELSKNVFTSDRGAFRIDDIPAGTRLVVARKIGYKELTTSIAFAGTQTVERSLLLSGVATLDTIAVTESAALPDFEEHRRLGLGRFLTRADLEKLQGQPIGNLLSQVGGAGIARGKSNQAWILTSRPRTTADGFWCPDELDRWEAGEGVKCGCYAKVYLDRTLMNPGVLQRDERTGDVTRPTPPFNVNSIPSMSIEAVEWYAGPSETPMKYSTLDSACGVLVIHTRRSK